jgi:hypothetical protein
LDKNIKDDEKGEACSTHGTDKKYFDSRLLVGLSEGKSLLGMSRHRWEDILKCIFRK